MKKNLQILIFLICTSANIMNGLLDTSKKIFVGEFGGKRYTIDVYDNTTKKDLYEIVSKKTEKNIKRIVFRGEEIERNDALISTCGIQKTSILFIVFDSCNKVNEVNEITEKDDSSLSNNNNNNVNIFQQDSNGNPDFPKVCDNNLYKRESEITKQNKDSFASTIEIIGIIGFVISYKFFHKHKNL